MKIDIDKTKIAKEQVREDILRNERQQAEKHLRTLVSELNNGHHEVMLNNDLMNNFPSFILNHSDKSNDDDVGNLLNALSSCVVGNDKHIRERSVTVLSMCLSDYTQREKHNFTRSIVGNLVRWLGYETRFVSVSGTICVQLAGYCKNNIVNNSLEEASHILNVLHQIKSGILLRNNAIQSVVCRTLDTIASDQILEKLTGLYLHGSNGQRQQTEKILSCLGKKSTSYLLDTLLSTSRIEDRNNLINLISICGSDVESVLNEFLDKDYPWFALCTIINMLTSINESKHIPAIIPLLEHEDLRVQQQVVDSIIEAAGDEKGKHLLTALSKVDDELKASLIGQIGHSSEPDATEIFLDLLAQRDEFSPNVRDAILKNLVVHVRLSTSIRAVNLLTMILEERSKHSNPSDDSIAQAIKLSLQILKARFHPKDQGRQVKQRQASFNKTISLRQKTEALDNKVKELINSGQAEVAGQLLYRECKDAARTQQFDIAKQIKNQILETDPNALAEVIRAGEIIEEEQSSIVIANHITIWRDIYDSLSTTEFNTFYIAMKVCEYSSGSIIVQQGEKSQQLFFVNSGSINMTCSNGEEEVFLKQIGPGEIAGDESFFNVSLSTITLTATANVNVQIIHRQEFDILLQKTPELESFLFDYCVNHEQISGLLKTTGEDRRQYKRYPLSRSVKLTLYKEHGNLSCKSFKGKMADLSCGGLSFIIGITNKNKSKALLGRLIETSLDGLDNEPIVCKGKIVAVRQKHERKKEYSVHVQFEKSISNDHARNLADTN